MNKFVMGPAAASVQDLDKILLLMKEYGEKLRSITDDYSTFRSRQLQTLAVMFIAIITGATTVYAYIFDRKELTYQLNDQLIPIMVATIGAVGAFFVLSTTLLARRRYRHSYDAHQIAATVERLIQMGSQYKEHASNRIGEKFEFELRLAEAEAALRLYQDVFERPLRLP